MHDRTAPGVMRKIAESQTPVLGAPCLTPSVTLP